MSKSTVHTPSAIVTSHSNDEKGFMASEACEALNCFKHEMMEVLQLPKEELDKVDHIELRVEWVPKLTARVYPKKHNG